MMSAILRDMGLRLGRACLGIFVTFGLLSGLPQAALACSCADPDSPCAEINARAVIFVGRVLDGGPTNFTDGTGAHPAMQFHFAVDEWIQGDIDSKSATVLTSIDGSTCGYPFKVGEAYLVYSDSSPQGLVTSICSRTAFVSERQADLTLLHEFKAGKVHPILFGGVYRFGLLLDGFMHLVAVERLQDVSVTAQGTDSRVTSTNERGEFSIVDLKPGSYEVRPQLPSGTKILFPSQQRVVVDQCSAEIWYGVASTPLAGTVRNPDGSSVGNVRIDILREDTDADPTLLEQRAVTFSEPDGTWEAVGLPPGRYRVGVNVRGKPTPASPYPPTWYTGSSTATEPLVLNLTNESTTHIDFRPTARLAEIQIPGIVVDGADTPVSGANIVLSERDSAAEVISRTTSNAEGRFVIAGLEGRRYQVQASRVQTGSRGWLRSGRQDVTGDTAAQSLKLVMMEVDR